MSTLASQLFLSITPRTSRFRQTDGGAKFRPEQNDFVMEFNLEFINQSSGAVTISPVGNVMILDKNGDEILQLTLDYSDFAPITIEPNSRSAGWWFDIWITGSPLPAKEIIGVSVTFSVPNHPVRGRTSVIVDSTAWKARMGPGINIIRVGSEDFTSNDNQQIIDGLRITNEIYQQVDFTLGESSSIWYILC